MVRSRAAAVSSRVKSTGSASVIGSTITRPAGTRIAHRRDKVWSERARKPATTNPITERDAAERRTTRRRGGVARSPRPCRRTAPRAARDPSSSAGGTLSGWRSSVPYARSRCARERDRWRRRERRVRERGRDGVRRGPERCLERGECAHHHEERCEGSERRECDRSRREHRDHADAPRAPQQHLDDDARRIRPVGDCIGDRRCRGERQRDPCETEKPDRHTRRARSIRLHQRVVRILRTSMTDRPNDTLDGPLAPRSFPVSRRASDRFRTPTRARPPRSRSSRPRAFPPRRSSRTATCGSS